MRTFVPALLSLLLASCATAPQVTLQQIEQKRVFALTRADVFETVRFFCLKDGFSLDSFEEEIGRIIGHRAQQATTSDRSGKLVIMHLKVLPVDTAHSEVTAQFTFSSLNDALTRDEEQILVDCYSLLYNLLERKAE